MSDERNFTDTWHAKELAKGQLWVEKDGTTVRIMAVVDNWVMARYLGCMPFVRPTKKFLAEFTYLRRSRR